MADRQLTPNDEELIELAYSTTYRSSIREMLNEADTSRCREILQRILDDLENEGDCLRFHLESAWEPLYEAWDFICGKFKTLTAYFIGEEPGCDVYLKRDNPDNGWFPDNYYLDVCTPKEEYIHEYFTNIDDAFRYIERITDTNIITADDITALNSAWSEEYEDAYIYLHEFTEV